MPSELALYITHYGYFAIFSLIFLQELGVPNPVPNEFILLFAGYLSWLGTLSFPLVILVGVSADFIGTSVLYAIFYLFGHVIEKKKPRWLKFAEPKIEKLRALLTKRGRWGIFIGRLIPYARGYASVVAGFLDVPPQTFLPMVFLSAVLWSGGYVVLGHILGRTWESFLMKVGGIQGLLIMVLVLAMIFYFTSLHKKGKHTLGENDHHE
jgi:membrane protein DedA with SNARE-associated domain